MKQNMFSVLTAMLFLFVLSTSAMAFGPDPRVRVLHASPDAPSVDVWANGDVLFSDVEFGELTDFLEVPRGMYNIQVVPTGMMDPVVIDADLNLWRFRDYTVVATGFLDEIEPLVIPDGRLIPRGQASVRFVHASPDAPAVDIAVADGPILFEDIEFREIGHYMHVPAGEYDLEVRVAGTDTVALEVPDVMLDKNIAYTVFAIGSLDEGTLQAKLVEDLSIPGYGRNVWRGRYCSYMEDE